MGSYGRKYSREDMARMIQAEGDGLADQLRERISVLEAENAALRAELADTKRKHDATLTHLFAARQSRARLARLVRELRCQRDDFNMRLAASEHARFMGIGLINQKCAERNAARESRKRLVGLVRHLRAWFSATAPDSAYVKRITDERDAARAWAAAWKRAAKWWFEEPSIKDRRLFVADFAEDSCARRSGRARRAAEAMERR